MTDKAFRRRVEAAARKAGWEDKPFLTRDKKSEAIRACWGMDRRMGAFVCGWWWADYFGKRSDRMCLNECYEHAARLLGVRSKGKGE